MTPDPFRPSPLAPPAPAGTFTACLVALVALGERRHEYPGGESRKTEDIFCVWEYEDDGGERRFIARDVSLSYHPKSTCWAVLCALLGAKAAANASLADALGKSCSLTIAHKASEDGTRTFARIGGYTALKRNEAPLTPSHPPFVWKKGDSDAILCAKWLPRLYGKPLLEAVNE
jgi:hypothetical protein